MKSSGHGRTLYCASDFCSAMINAKAWTRTSQGVLFCPAQPAFFTNVAALDKNFPFPSSWCHPTLMLASALEMSESYRALQEANLCTWQWKLPYKHKARIPFQASTVMDQASHLTAASRKAFASLCCHLSNELHRRKQLPRQPWTPPLKHKPFKGCFEPSLSLVSHCRPVWEQADSPVTVPLLSPCTTARSVRFPQGTKAAQAGLPNTAALPEDTGSGQEGKLPGVLLNTLAWPVSITPRDRWSHLRGTRELTKSKQGLNTSIRPVKSQQIAAIQSPLLFHRLCPGFGSYLMLQNPRHFLSKRGQVSLTQKAPLAIW